MSIEKEWPICSCGEKMVWKHHRSMYVCKPCDVKAALNWIKSGHGKPDKYSTKKENSDAI